MGRKYKEGGKRMGRRREEIKKRMFVDMGVS